MSSDISNNSIVSDNSNSSDNSSDDDDIKSQAECIRNRSNFSIVKSFHLIDKKDFDKDMLNVYIDNNAGPKIKLLIHWNMKMKY